MSDPIAKQTPWDLLPSPEVTDHFWVEVVDRYTPGYQRFAPGEPHPDRSKYPNTLLADEKPVEGDDNLVHRYWATDPTNQDAYNFGLTYSSEAVACPIWARRYVVRRDLYAPVATGTAFTGVFLVRVDDGGSGYVSPPAVTFTGGSGAGATAVCFISAGAVKWVRITAEGTGYTGTPAVAFVGGNGSGATATALMQGAAKLVHQELQELPQDDPRRSLWVGVLRVWETLPGPQLVGEYWDFTRGVKVTVYNQVVVAGTSAPAAIGEIASRVTSIDSVKSHLEKEISDTTGAPAGTTRPDVWFTKQHPDTGTDIYHITRYVAAGTALPTLNAQIDVGGATGLYIIYRDRKIYSVQEDEWTLLACALPATYLDFNRKAIRFPGLFTWLNQFFVSFSFPYSPPFPGINYTYLAPRTNTLPARNTHFFTVGQPPNIPEKFRVLSPGTMSKMVPIHEDTIHPAFNWNITVNDVTTTVESIPASDPASYDPNAIYIYDVDSHRWEGSEIWETIITEASEGKSITYFPPVQQGVGLTIGPYGGGLTAIVDYSTTGFCAVNTNAGAKVVSLFGFLGPTWTKVSGTLPVDAGLVNLGSGVLNTLNFISGDGVSQSDGVAIYSSGTAGTALVSITGTPADGDQIKLGFLHGTASYTTTYTFKTALSENVRSTSTLTISGVVIDAETVTIGTEIYEFDSTTGGGVTSPNKRVDITPYSVAAQGVITVTADSAGDTFTIGSKVFTLVTAGTQAIDGQVPAYNTSDSSQQSAVYAAINGLDGVNTVHPTVSCGGFGASNAALLTAKAGGTAGNSIATTSPGSQITFDAGTLGTARAGTACLQANAVTALVAGIMGTAGGLPSTIVTAVDGAGDTVVVTSIIGGTAANYTTSQTMAHGAWSGNMTGGVAATANQIAIGGSATNSSINLQRAINGSIGQGTSYSSGTTHNLIVTVPTITATSSFTLATVIAADWEAFGSWQTGSNFDWSYSGNGAIVVGTFGSVANISGAANGNLIGTLSTAQHSLICNLQAFDDSTFRQRNFPTTPDTLITGTLNVGNKNFEIWYGGYGGMQVSYEKSIDGLTNWIAGTTSLPTGSPTDGAIHTPGITDFGGVSLYRWIRFKITTGISLPPHDYGLGNVSRLFIQCVFPV